MKKRAKNPVSCALHPRTLLPKGPVAVVRAVWFLAIFWYEVGTFHWSIAACPWPDVELVPKVKEGRSPNTPLNSQTHVLLVADPRVHSPSRNAAWRRWLRLTDISLRKRWSFVRRVQPDVTVFLGDMLDNGRYADDDEFGETFEYFKSIFSVDPSTEVYYVPGNRDVGLGPSSRMNTAHARRRYSKYIAPLNSKVSIANHTLVMLDAPGLVDEDYRRATSGMPFESWQALPDGTVDFINKFAAVGSEEPVILFSHIPLFRPDTAGCGPLREKGSIRRGVGPGFQNMLMRETTKYILRYVRPAAVFSGNDHDYCEYTHSIPLVSVGPDSGIDYVREVTVKAISSAENIRRPGFQLLSLSPSSTHSANIKTFADVPCFLPREWDIFLSRYLPLLLLSLVVLLVAAIRRHHTNRQHPGDSQEDYVVVGNGNEVLPLSASPHEDSNKQGLNPVSLFNSGRTTGASSLAPTLRATANQYPPHTPDFAVAEESLREYYSPVHPVFAPRISEDAAGDEDDFHEPSQMARYRTASDKGSDYFRLTLDRAKRRRQLAWSWTFELGGRRRRLTVGVPFLMEHVCRKFWAAATTFLLGERSGLSTQESIFLDFLRNVLSAGWPSLLLFCLIYLVLLK